MIAWYRMRLRWGDPHTRSRIISKLRDAGSDRHTALLSELVSGREDEASGEAIDALAEIGSVKALDALASAAKAGGGAVTRLRAALGLLQKGDGRGLETFIGLLSDPDRSVRDEAGRALKCWGPDIAPMLRPSLESRDFDTRRRAVEVLDELPAPPSNDYERALYAIARGDMEGAIRAGLGVSSFLFQQTLSTAAAADTGWDRDALLDALEAANDPRALQCLLVHSFRHDEMWRPAAGSPASRAERAIISLGGEAEDILIALLELKLDPMPLPVRRLVVSLLGRIGKAAAVMPLANQAMGKYSMPEAKEALIGLLGRVDDLTPFLGELTENLLHLDGHRYPIRDALLQATMRLGQRAIEPLASLFASGKVAQQRFAAEALGEIGGPRASDILISRLDEKIEEYNSLPGLKGSDLLTLIHARLEALEKAADERALPTLERAAIQGGDYGTFRHRMIPVFVRIGRPAIGTLAALLTNPYREVRCIAAESMGLIGDREALGPLIAAMNDPDHGVIVAAIRSLGRLGDPAAIPPLLERLDEPPASLIAGGQSTFHEVIDALGKLKAAAAEGRLIDLLAKPGYFSRENVIAALGEIGGRLAVETLIRICRQEPPSPNKATANSEIKAAASALGNIGDPAACEALAEGTRREDCPETCTIALARLGDPRGVRILLDYIDRKHFSGSALSSLEVLLESTIAEVPTDELERILRLKHSVPVDSVYHPDSRWDEPSRVITQSTERVKRGALAEIQIRNGSRPVV